MGRSISLHETIVLFIKIIGIILPVLFRMERVDYFADIFRYLFYL